MSPISEESAPVAPIRSVPDIDTVDSQHSPYFLHSADHPGLSLVTDRLDGTNYNQWSSAMKIALEAKNKLEFIDGSLPHPEAGTPLYRIWSRCNIMVKTLWDQLDGSEPSESCLCCHSFNCASKREFQAKVDRGCLIKFLAGLNETYSIIRRKIIMKRPLPEIFEVYNILDQNDSQRQFGTTVVPVACQVGDVGHHPGVVNAAVYSNVAAGSLNIVVPATFQVGTVGHHPSVVIVAVSSNSDSSLTNGIYDKDDCVFAGKRFCFKQRMFGCLKCSQQVIVHCFRTKTSHGALCATHDLLLKQSLPLVSMRSQSRDYDFTKHLLLDLSGRFGTSIEILFGSLPRPPETHCDFSSSYLQFMWHSSSPR